MVLAGTKTQFLARTIELWCTPIDSSGLITWKLKKQKLFGFIYNILFWVVGTDGIHTDLTLTFHLSHKFKSSQDSGCAKLSEKTLLVLSITAQEGQIGLQPFSSYDNQCSNGLMWVLALLKFSQAYPLR